MLGTRPKTTLEAVERELVYARARGRWVTSYEIQALVKENWSMLCSESAITARIRDLRKARYGGHRIDCRRRSGSTSYEYRMG